MNNLNKIAWKRGFSWHELVANNNGKTSGSGFIGVYLGIIAGLMAIASTVGYFLNLPNTIEFIGQILQLIVAATVLLTTRKITGDYLSQKSNSNILDSSTNIGRVDTPVNP